MTIVSNISNRYINSEAERFVQGFTDYPPLANDLGSHLTIVYQSSILTDMKRILITIDDDSAKELAKSKNQSETIRHALKVYQSGISTETFAGIAASYRITEQKLKEIDSKLDYIAKKL